MWEARKAASAKAAATLKAKEMENIEKSKKILSSLPDAGSPGSSFTPQIWSDDRDERDWSPLASHSSYPASSFSSASFSGHSSFSAPSHSWMEQSLFVSL